VFRLPPMRLEIGIAHQNIALPAVVGDDQGLLVGLSLGLAGVLIEDLAGHVGHPHRIALAPFPLKILLLSCISRMAGRADGSGDRRTRAARRPQLSVWKRTSPSLRKHALSNRP